MLQTAKGRSITFIFLVAAISIVVDKLISRGLFGHAGSLAYMWCPALAAIAASIVTRRSFKQIGWRPRFKWIALGWLIPIGYGFITYGAVWLTRLGDFPKSTFPERARMILNMSATQPDWIVIVAAFGYITVALLPPSLIGSLGEEIGWRGFLVPELNNWLGFRGACLVSGAVWTLWHLPAILFRGYGVTGTPKSYQVVCFAVLVMATSVILAWLRIRSGSVWPATILHATHNAVIQLFFDPITAHKTYTQYFVGEFGVGLALPLAVLAWYCMRDMSKQSRAVTADSSPFPISDIVRVEA